MKLLLLGGTRAASDMLEKLLGKSRHQLVWRQHIDDLWPDSSDCDMVLVDGAAADCATIDQLLDQLRRIRNRSPRMPILVLSAVTDVAQTAGQSCGITRSADGASHMRCRLRELAWNETAALLRETLERPALEPIVFEYQG